jgi:hypothetical protein
MQRLIVSLFLISFSFLSAHALESNNSTSLNVAAIEKARLKGQFDHANNVYKISMPRDDISVAMNGMKMTSEMGLTSLVTFSKADTKTSMSGDLILLQDQVNPVMSVALNNNLQVTNLHSPFLWDSPRVLIMHIKAEGDEYTLAKAVNKVFAEIKRSANGNGEFPYVGLDGIQTTLDTHKVNDILHGKTSFKNGVYKVVLDKDKKLINTWVTFAGSNASSIVEGGLTVHEADLQKTLITLRKAQFFVVAIYQHPVNDDNTYVYVNYWGIGNAQALAKTLHTAFSIAQQDTVKPAESVVGSALSLLSMAQSETCHTTKKWAKELFPLMDGPVKHENAPDTSSTSNEVTASTGSHAVEANNTLVNHAPSEPGVITKMVRHFDSGTSVMSAARELPVEQKSVKNITPFTNTQKLSEYVAGVFGLEVKSALYAVPSGLLHDLLSAQNRDYNYLNKMVKSAPVTFTVSTQEQKIAANTHNDLSDTHQLAQHIASALRSQGSLHADSSLVASISSSSMLAMNKDYQSPEILEKISDADMSLVHVKPVTHKITHQMHQANNGWSIQHPAALSSGAVHSAKNKTSHADAASRIPALDLLQSKKLHFPSGSVAQAKHIPASLAHQTQMKRRHNRYLVSTKPVKSILTPVRVAQRHTTSHHQEAYPFDGEPMN